ncbi:MAG: four helix bundle protein [Phycisphaerales bacterium]|nr:four helix bundle protein [Phycisphaerales bacterium]
MGEIKTFRDLIAWQKAMTLAKEVYKATSLMPDSERFGRTAQRRRAAVSVPSNIAEGHGRQSLPDYIRFLKTSRGSLMELQTQLLLAQDLGFIRLTGELPDILSETDRVLQGLIRSLQKVQSDGERNEHD